MPASEKIKFHLDEHVDPDVAQALRRHGIDVTTTVEAGLRGADDQTQIRFAKSGGRVLVTHDTDFLQLANTESSHPGIAYCGMSELSIGEIIQSLILIHEVLTPAELTGRVSICSSKPRHTAGEDRDITVALNSRIVPQQSTQTRE